MYRNFSRRRARRPQLVVALSIVAALAFTGTRGQDDEQDEGGGPNWSPSDFPVLEDFDKMVASIEEKGAMHGDGLPSSPGGLFYAGDREGLFVGPPGPPKTRELQAAGCILDKALAISFAIGSDEPELFVGDLRVMIAACPLPVKQKNPAEFARLVKTLKPVYDLFTEAAAVSEGKSAQNIKDILTKCFAGMLKAVRPILTVGKGKTIPELSDKGKAILKKCPSQKPQECTQISILDLHDELMVYDEEKGDEEPPKEEL